MATKIDVNDLKDHPDQILERVAEQGEEFLICSDDHVMAHLVPAPEMVARMAAWKEWRRGSDELTARISAAWQGPQDAVEAIRDERAPYIERQSNGGH